MFAAFIAPGPAFQPDTDRAATTAPAPLRLAGLLRRVDDYGKQLLVAVRLRSACPEFPRLAKPFGTAELRLILARISGAMGRVLVLEDRCHREGNLGRYSQPERTREPAERRPRTVRPDAMPDQDRNPPPAPALPRRADNPLVPTMAQLASELRRHPVGVVLAGICRDLGITPYHPLWDEVCHAVAAYGGSIAELAQDEDTEWCSKRWLEIPLARPPSVPAYLWPKWWPQPEPPAVAATGPPLAV